MKRNWIRAWLGGAGLFLFAITIAATSPGKERSITQDRRPFDLNPRVNAILHRACVNCHSNETQWPWYAHISPVGWLIRRDVRKAREHLNFSEQPLVTANQRREIYDSLADRSMPPGPYLLVHREARLSSDDLAALSAWCK